MNLHYNMILDGRTVDTWVESWIDRHMNGWIDSCLDNEIDSW